MGYLGRRIGLSQDQGDSNPGAAGGAVGGGLLDLISHGYFERQGDLYNAPGVGSDTGAPQGITATGGVISDYITTPGDVYRAHVFTSSGALNVTDTTSNFGATIEYLVVAGGGSGGQNLGGGGGAGGLRTNLSGHPEAAPSYTVSAQSYTVTVGAGGAPVIVNNAKGNSGSNSEFYPTPQSYPSTNRVRSVGGGGGAGGNASYPAPDRAGGSGGGAPGYGVNPTGGPGNTSDPNHPKRQGYDGGQNGPNYGNNYIGGGGGGAGGAGVAGDRPGGTATDSATSGNGGPGSIVNIIPSPPAINSGNGYHWAGGGGAGAYTNSATNRDAGDGGLGGGGGGASNGTPTKGIGGGSALNSGGDGTGGLPDVQSFGGNGGASTGGGGGSTGHNANIFSGSGGSGVVVVRYQIGRVTATAKATGGAISFYNGKTIHTFTGSGALVALESISGVEYVLVGGGGGGNSSIGGGGGAGAFVYSNGSPETITLSANPYPVVIGAGANIGTPGNDGVQGGDTIWNGYTAGGGGGGQRNSPDTNTVGRASTFPQGSRIGAGGGGGSGNSNEAGASGAAGGYAGGQGNDPTLGSGGGGGSGGAGEAGNSNSGRGGIGRQLPSTFRNPVSVTALGYPGPTGSVPATNPGGDTSGKYWVAGGGGGGARGSGPQSQAGGYGAGGSSILGGQTPDNAGYSFAGAGNGVGTNHSGLSGGAAAAASGSGGGGSGDNRSPDAAKMGGRGGSGIVLIAYPS